MNERPDDSWIDPQAPTPPPSSYRPAAYGQTLDGAPTAPAPPGTQRCGGRRLLAAGTAVAVLIAAGGAGFALGHQQFGSDNTAGSAPRTWYGGFTGQLPSGGSDGTAPFGGTPFNGQGGQGTPNFDSSSTTGTPATATQLTGLVRVATTLGYQDGKAAGTGMVLTSAGEVITNHHVVEGATEIRVKVMSTGKTYHANVVGTDSLTDVAVLQLIGASGLQTVTTDTAPVSVGDAVIAVGDAGGNVGTFSAASGKVTALGRHITTRSQDGSASEKLRHMIEISSDVISGDSGGATYDDQGEVVAMTTAASSGSSDVVGFAIPITRVLRIAGDLESGVVRTTYDYGHHGFLGIALGATGTRVAGTYAGTPAAKAGIVGGDRIMAVDGTQVSTSAALRRLVEGHQPGDRLGVTWTDQGGRSHTATVTLIAGPVA